jgi:hypothetical protein
VARDDWRLRIELGDEAAGGLQDRLAHVYTPVTHLSRVVRDRKLAVTRDGPAGAG